MGRSSRLFPLPGRKTPISSQPSANSSREDQSQLSKAERVLGATGLHGTSRQPLPRHRTSYTSLQTPSISEVGEEVEYDDFSSPDHFGLEPLPLRLANLQQKAAPNLALRPPVPDASFLRSSISGRTRKVKGSWSSTTLNTCYESANTESSQTHHSSHTTRHARNWRSDPPHDLEPNNRQRPSTASVDSSGYGGEEEMDRATALPNMSR